MSDLKYQYTEFQTMSSEEIVSWYDAQAPKYNANLMYIDRYFGVRGMRQHLFAGAKGDVLEVACGTAENLRYIQPAQVTSLTAVDFSPGMLEIAKLETTKLGLNVEFHLMDAQDLQFPNAKFDTVISSLASCTFPDPVKALGEMARVCKPDGRVLLVEHGRSHIAWMGRLQDRWAHGIYQHQACRWNQDTLALVKASGLRIVEAHTRLLGILHAIEAAPA
jgi:ubiquinone/menaquinone biosynthesis C-methylase UbiE